jgi:methanol---5-hydroxybenzimidazolylcobamide Co-methyltransferase
MALKRQYSTRMAYSSVSEMVFGKALHPVSCRTGVPIGNGRVLPEVNFTLPSMLIGPDTMPAVRERFRDMVDRILKRAVELHLPELVLEFEQLFEMTRTPTWGAAVTADIKEVMEKYQVNHGLRSALRVTIADIRDQIRPPNMRSGEQVDCMLQAMHLCASAGADILSIESTGGKEVHDQSLLEADIDGITFALGVLAPRDMEFLWGQMVDICRQHHIIPGGDTACGFGNTAMQLSHQGMLPGVLAAVVRLMTAPRSLVAVEMGATGPLKDCGYENPIIKAITGVPISMEGKTSACAHSSPLGNIAAAFCDLWSNESVQDVRLLSGFTPEIFTEMLIYDCRLMNTALQSGKERTLFDLLVQSDVDLDPQALMLDPDIIYRTGQAIVEAGPDDYQRTLAAARLALSVLKKSFADKRYPLTERDRRWLDMIESGIEYLPQGSEQLAERIASTRGELFLKSSYGIA